MPMLLLSLFLYTFLLLTGMVVIDSDNSTAKQMEVQRLLDNANHHASFALVEELKRQGVIEIEMTRALDRFHARMKQNGYYTWNQDKYLPELRSITQKPLPTAFYYIDFSEWKHSYRIEWSYNGTAIREDSIAKVSDAGSKLEIAVRMQDGTEYPLPPKIMGGPCLIAISVIDENPILKKAGSMTFPVVSVQEIKY